MPSGGVALASEIGGADVGVLAVPRGKETRFRDVPWSQQSAAAVERICGKRIRKRDLIRPDHSPTDVRTSVLTACRELREPLSACADTDEGVWGSDLKPDWVGGQRAREVEDAELCTHWSRLLPPVQLTLTPLEDRPSSSPGIPTARNGVRPGVDRDGFGETSRDASAQHEESDAVGQAESGIGIRRGVTDRPGR